MFFLQPRFVVMRNIWSLRAEPADVLNYTVAASTSTQLTLSGWGSLDNTEFDLAVVRGDDAPQSGGSLRFESGGASLSSAHEIVGRFVAEVRVRPHVFDALVRNALVRKHFDSVALQVIPRPSDSAPEFMSYDWNRKDDSPAALHSVVFHTTLSHGLSEYAG
jgi:hypothetical protein